MPVLLFRVRIGSSAQKGECLNAEPQNVLRTLTMVDGFDDWIEEQEEEPRPRDERTDRAKTDLRERIQGSDRVYYVQQLQVLHERDYFHWITGRALRELIDEGSVNAVWEQLLPDVPIRLIMRRSHRYWRREAQRVLKLVRRYSAIDFGRAMGSYGELLVDAALGTVGVHLLGRDVRELDGRIWTNSEHNLDRAFELDGVRYGVEIKNTLK